MAARRHRSAGSDLGYRAHVASRWANRVQLTKDALKAYLDAVEDAFGGDIDYAKLVKLYGPGAESAGRYSPAECIGTRKERMMDKPITPTSLPAT